MKVAMFSYNGFVSGERNGWKVGANNDLLLIQDPEGRPWGTTQSGLSISGMTSESHSAIGTAWQALEAEIPKLDKFIIYVGSYGAERAIELAKQNNIPAGKITFVMCDCGLSNKLQSIRKCSYEVSTQVMCECGGRSTMNRLYQEYMR